MNLSFFLTVAQNITESEAEAITHLTDVFSSRRTDEYNLLGLSRPGISKAQPRGTDDEKKIDENKEKDGDKQEYVHKRLYLLSFNVDPIMYMDMYNNIDIDTITNELNRIINNKYYQNLPWIIERIKMEQTIKNPNAGRYFKLLNLGSPLDSICMRKSFDKRRSSSVLKFSSTCADLEIKSLNESELYTELTLKKTKLKYVFGSRKIEKLPGNFDDLEKTMWQYYFKELSGSGAYYTYVKADEIISKYVRSRKLKERYRALLKCVAHYKGLAPFFRHIGKPDPHFSDINYFKDNETALRDIRGLEAIGVNPVTISRRMATDSLPNIIELIK